MECFKQAMREHGLSESQIEGKLARSSKSFPIPAEQLAIVCELGKERELIEMWKSTFKRLDSDPKLKRQVKTICEDRLTLRNKTN